VAELVSTKSFVALAGRGQRITDEIADSLRPDVLELR
jgi:hypothetical protein